MSLSILSLVNCPLDPTFGSAKTALAFAERLHVQGNRVRLIGSDDYELKKPSGRAIKFRQAIGAYRWVREYLRSEKVDLIEGYGDEFWLLFRMMRGESIRPRLVMHTNGFELLEYRSRARYGNDAGMLRRLWNRSTHERLSLAGFKSADFFVSLCELDCHYARELGLFTAQSSITIPPGLDREFLNRPFQHSPELRIAFVGSWIPRKGIHVLHEVIVRMAERYPDLVFDLFGTRCTEAELRGQFEAPVRDRIIVHPKLTLPEMGERLSRASVFLFPSLYEGFGLAVAEAMACGLAVIVTPTGFGAEIIPDVEGLRCEFGDVEGTIAAASSLIDDPQRRIRLAQAGWSKVQQLTWERAGKALDSAYRKLCQAG